MSETPTPNWRDRVRSNRWGSIVLSWDFVVGILIGVALGVAPAVSTQVAESTGSILGGVAAVGAAVATLVLTAMTVLISVFGKAYTALLERLPNGLTGALRPYLIVVVVSVVTSLLALAACLVWPAMISSSWALRWVVAAVPMAGISWALLGCIQTVQQLIQHVGNNRAAEDLAERAQRATANRRAG